MTALNLTATDNRQQTVLEHLIPLVSATLAEKINNGVAIEKDGKRLINKKDLSTFMVYAAEQARKTLSDKEQNGAQAVCVHGDDIMNWAIHYFEEDSIEGKLYNEDGTEYTPPKPVYKPNTPIVPYTPPKPKPEPQLSMFDMLDKQEKEEPANVTLANSQETVEEADDNEPTEKEVAEVLEDSQMLVDEETGEVLSISETADTDDDLPPIDTKAFDPEALGVLDELFGNSIILR